MIQVKFKNMAKSEFAQRAATERLESVIERFPDLAESSVQMTMAMENSPLQAGPDVFVAKIYVRGGRYGGIALEKSDANLYGALAKVIEHTLERLNRFGDRQRVKERTMSRRLAARFQRPSTSSSALSRNERPSRSTLSN